MKLTPEQELEIAIIKVNYHKICDLFDLDEEQRKSPNAGQWIVNSIKQFQTSYTLARAGKLIRSEMQDNPQPPSLPNTNPLLTEEMKNG